MEEDDVLELILLKLGTRDVARGRCVSRAWHRLLTSKFFLAQHAKAAQVVSGAGEALLVLYDVDSGAPDWDSGKAAVVNVSVARAMSGTGTIGVGFFPAHVCQGFVLFARVTGRYDPLLILNPATGEMQNLPPPPQMDRRDWKMVGMGYSPSTNQYKVFRFTFRGSSGYADVVTLGVGGNWRRMKQLFVGCHGMDAPPPAVVGGELCLLAKDHVSDRFPRLLMLVEVASEVYRKCRLPVPDQAADGVPVPMDVFDLHGKPCVAVHGHGPKIHFLVLGREGDTWETLWCFDIAAATQALHSSWTDDNGLWYQHGDNMYNYHPATTSTCQAQAWSRQLQLPVASLLPPCTDHFRMGVFGGYHPNLLSPHSLDTLQQDVRDDQPEQELPPTATRHHRR